MAKLTDQLATDMQGKPVRDPGYVPKGTATAIGAVAEGLDAFITRKTEMDAARKKAEESAFKKQGYAAEFDAFNALNSAQELAEGSQPMQTAPLNPDDLSPEQKAERAGEGAPLSAEVFNAAEAPAPEQVMGDATKAAERLQSVQAAVDQATMPAISLNAAMQHEFQRIINKYPEHTTAIIEVWKKMGVDNALFRSIRSEQKLFDANQDRQIKLQDTWLEEGMKVLGPAASGMTDTQIMAEGVRAINQNWQLDQLQTRTNIAAQQANINESERKLLQEDNINEANALALQDVHNRSVGIKQALQQVMNSIAAKPIGEQQAAFEEFAPRMEQLRANLVDQMVVDYKTKFPAMDEAKLRTSLEAATKSLVEPFTGDIKTASANLNALKAMETRIKIDSAEAMPVFTALKTLGLEGPEIETAMIGMSPDMLAALRREIKGFSGEFGQERASTRMMNIFSMLKGKGKPFADMNPGEQKEAVNVSMGTFLGETERFNRGQIADTTMMVNKAGVIVTAARGVGPGSSLKTLNLVTTVLATSGPRKALVQTATNPNDPNSEQAMATLMGIRGANALVLETVQAKIAKGEAKSRYYSIDWDNKAGKYRIVPNREAYARDEKARKDRALSAPRSFGGTDPALNANRPIDASVPEDMKTLVNVANQNLESVIALKDYDPNTPKGTDLELRNYYGRNIIPASMKQGKGAADPTGDINTMFEKLEEAFEKSPAILHEVKPNQERIVNYKLKGETGISQVPASVQTLGDFVEWGNGMINELKGKVQGDVSTAAGVFQITKSTYEEFGERALGKDWKSQPYTADVQDRVAREIFYDAKGKGASALRGRWAGLTAADAKKLLTASWEEAREIIQDRESR